MSTDSLPLIPAWVEGVLCPMDKFEVHRRGLRHKAISVFIMNGERMLIQRRAMGKYHTPGLWANACCTHPFWGEDARVTAYRRLEEELGISTLSLSEIGVVSYRADVGQGMIEDEEVTMFAAAATAELAPRPNPAEVMDWRWITLSALDADMKDAPARYTPWLRIYMAEHREMILGPGG